jgi:S-adenosylmethionine:tRNA ribosyltransferase-isomerase
MRTADFEFQLPPELIAQDPAPSRIGSRLLVLHRASGRIEHRQFRDFREYLREGDVLVLNDSRVIPARLRARRVPTGGAVEILLLEENAANDWWCLLHPGRHARVGTELVLRDRGGQKTDVAASVLEDNAAGHRRLRFTGAPNIADLLEVLGEVPLPPYIRRPDGPTPQDAQRYQTVFARRAGSVAAPTAGLHFTDDLLNAIRSQGVEVCFLTLHVGWATFAPVKVETITAHELHDERFELGEEAAQTINRARGGGRRIVAVGTTTVRVLESVAARNDGRLVAGAGRTRLFIHPPYRFRMVDALLTNFHLPRSTLLMLASAFAAPEETRGRELLLSAYAEAIRERYRFFSYGDAMFIV